MNEVPKQRWGCLQRGIVIGCVLLLIALSIAALNLFPEMSRQMRAMRNCKSIILALEHWSHDNGMGYPDAWPNEFKSSNQVFRRLFTDEIITDERVFECPGSVFILDNDVGHPPNYDKALAPGECHWMLLKQQTGAAPQKMPLIIENSLNTSWPPKWGLSAPNGVRKRGQAWSGRQIIIGRNDGSVQVEKLREDGTLDWHSPPNLDEHGKSWIDYLTPEEIAKLSYWDIEEK
ncbi:MAG: hypothetical protein U1A53_26960 [Prosthecobacter sp.]|nr:hypothetical protein [Prosthecobacter sp.]